MCSGSEAGSYLKLIDFVYHLTLGLRVIKNRKKTLGRLPREHGRFHLARVHRRKALLAECQSTIFKTCRGFAHIYTGVSI